MTIRILYTIFFILLQLSCDTDNNSPSVRNTSQNPGNLWLIPRAQVFDGGPGKDGIPALSNPDFVPVDQVDYLKNNDLVLGFRDGAEIRAYPHAILDWHEIINDELNGIKYAVTYCPLTGTGIAWDRELDGKETTFGVSGLLYNTNLIPYDRLSESNWSQIGMKCVNGKFMGDPVIYHHLIETSWQTWKALYPNSKVVSPNTGFDRSYGRYPYGNYKTANDYLLFPVSINDDRIPAKERVLAITDIARTIVYRFSSFTGGVRIIEDELGSNDIIIIGDAEKEYIVAFENQMRGKKRDYVIASDLNNPNVVFIDDLGNKYDLFGYVVSGPDQGKRLGAVTSFMAYWFSLGSFYSNIQIFEAN